MRNVGTWKQEKKETRTVANYNDITTKFSKLKGLAETGLWGSGKVSLLASKIL